jgi:hypothetical protein
VFTPRTPAPENRWKLSPPPTENKVDDPESSRVFQTAYAWMLEKDHPGWFRKPPKGSLTEEPVSLSNSQGNREELDPINPAEAMRTRHPIVSTRSALNLALGVSRSNPGHLEKRERNGELTLEIRGEGKAKAFAVTMKDPALHRQVAANIARAQNRNAPDDDV